MCVDVEFPADPADFKRDVRILLDAYRALSASVWMMLPTKVWCVEWCLMMFCSMHLRERVHVHVARNIDVSPDAFFYLWLLTHPAPLPSHSLPSSSRSPPLPLHRYDQYGIEAANLETIVKPLLLEVYNEIKAETNAAGHLDVCGPNGFHLLDNSNVLTLGENDFKGLYMNKQHVYRAAAPRSPP